MKKAILINNTGFVFHFGCQTVIENINNICIKNDIKILRSLLLEEKNKFNKINKIIKNNSIDLIIINGEGTIHHNCKEGIELLSIGKYIKEKFENVKIVIINSTFQEIDQYLFYLKYFDLINVREVLSKEYLNKNNIGCILTPDLSLYNTEKILFKKSLKSNIIYGGSVIKKIDNLFKENNNYRDIYYFPKEDHKYNIIFLKKLYYILYHKFSYLITYIYKGKIFFLKNNSEYINHLKGNNILISGRFHDLYMSLKGGISFYLLESNSYKIKSTLKYIGIENRLINENDLYKINLKNFNKKEIDKINLFIKKGQKDIENLFKKINNLG